MNDLEVFTEMDKKALESVSGHFLSTLKKQKEFVEDVAQNNEVLEKDLFVYKKNGKLFAMLTRGALVHSSLCHRIDLEELAKTKILKASAFNRSRQTFGDYNFARFCLNSLVCPIEYSFGELNSNKDFGGEYFLGSLEFYGSAFNTSAGISFIFDKKLTGNLVDVFQQDDKIIKEDLINVCNGDPASYQKEDHYKNDSIVPYGIPTGFIAGIVIKKHPRQSEITFEQEALVENLKKLFPTTYIAFSTGEIAYLPKNIKVNECAYQDF